MTVMEHQRPDVPCATCGRATHWTERTYVEIGEREEVRGDRRTLVLRPTSLDAPVETRGPYCSAGCYHTAFPALVRAVALEDFP